jgi:hypothetical protein
MPTPEVSSDNPFAAPQVIAGFPPPPPRLTFKRMLALLVISLAGGGALGAFTNTFNGAISPAYFRRVTDWEDNIWLLAIRQGALEGTVYGFAYALLFIVIIAFSSRRRCHFHTALRYVGLAFIMVFAFWFLGGLILTTAAWYSPELRDTWYCGYLGRWPAAGQYAWVAGSIYGGVRGGLVAVLVANTVYIFRHRWADLQESPSPDPTNAS